MIGLTTKKNKLKNFTLPRNRTVTENLKFESGEIQGYVRILSPPASVRVASITGLCECLFCLD